MKILLAAVLLLPSTARAAGSWSRALAPSLPLVKTGLGAPAAINLGKIKNLDGDFAAGVYAPLGAALSKSGFTPESFAALSEENRALALDMVLILQVAEAEARAKAVFRDYGREVTDRRLQRRAAQTAESVLMSPYYTAEAEERARLQKIGSYFREQADRERAKEVISNARREMRNLLRHMTAEDWVRGDAAVSTGEAAQKSLDALTSPSWEAQAREVRVEKGREALQAGRGLIFAIRASLLEETNDAGAGPDRQLLKWNELLAKLERVLEGPTVPRHATVEPLRREAAALSKDYRRVIDELKRMDEDTKALRVQTVRDLEDLLAAFSSSLEKELEDFKRSKKTVNQALLWQARTHVQVFVRDVSGAQDERFKAYEKDGSEGYYRDWKRVFYILEQAAKPSEKPTPDDIAQAVDLAVPLLNAYRDAVKGVPQVKDIRGKKQAAGELIKILYKLAGQAPR